LSNITISWIGQKGVGSKVIAAYYFGDFTDLLLGFHRFENDFTDLEHSFKLMIMMKQILLKKKYPLPINPFAFKSIQ